jgi:NAD(P)-dependent dehydrogenase (short-subunit alcohol dehydrogenase family)
MTATLVTGANKGLGFETARQLAAAGHKVWIGARDQTRGQRAADAAFDRKRPSVVENGASPRLGRTVFPGGVSSR